MFNLPNTLTLLNLLSGCLAIVCVFHGTGDQVLIFFLAALLFDLLDGFAARSLKIKSDLGAQLDSLADVVSFGVLPGVLLYTHLIQISGLDNYSLIPSAIVFVYPCAAALRLAKFNIDERQGRDFLGLNTPAASIALVGLYICAGSANCPDFLVWPLRNYVVVLVIVMVVAFLLLVDLPMLSFKPEFADRRRTRQQIILIIGGVIILAIWRTCSLPLLILWYVLFSLVTYLIGNR